MAKNITENVFELIALDDQLISMVEDLAFHLEFLNPRYALPSQHYIRFIPLLSYNTPYVHRFLGFHTAELVKQAIEEMLNTWVIDKQQVDVILGYNIRNMKKGMMIRRYLVWVAPHTHFSFLIRLLHLSARLCYELTEHRTRRVGFCVSVIDAWWSNTVKVDGQCLPDVDIM